MKLGEFKKKLEMFSENYDVVFIAPKDGVLDYDNKVNCIADKVLIIKLKVIPE